MDFETFLQDYFWVPIVIGILLIIIVVLILCYCCKCCRSGKDYEYMPLRSDGNAGGSRSSIEMGIGQRMNMEKDKKEQSFRSNAWINAQFYLRGKAQFSDIKQLENIGSRQHKTWFRLIEPRTQMHLIMSMIEKSDKIILPFTKLTEKTLKDLLMLLQHPFIYTIHDLDFMVDQKIIVVIYPFCKRGSLKDYIYQNKCLEDWKNKYNTKKQGLNTTQVKCFSKQILMALLYLEERGFPNHGHIHSGNVVIENNICRLMASESAFIGEEPKIYPVIKKKLKKNKASIDVLALGHLIFEMCTGSELNSAHPDPRDLLMCKSTDVIQILNFIFAENDRDYPTLQEIASQDFFSKVPLPELDNYNFAPINFNKEMKNILKAIKSGMPIVNRRKSKMKKSSDIKASMSAPDLQNTQQLNTGITHPSTRNVTVLPASQFTVTSPPPLGVPPPPPLAAPPPPIQASAISPQQSQDRGALLGDIQRGTKLKKTQTNDKSAPKVLIE